MPTRTPRPPGLVLGWELRGPVGQKPGSQGLSLERESQGVAGPWGPTFRSGGREGGRPGGMGLGAPRGLGVQQQLNHQKGMGDKGVGPGHCLQTRQGAEGRGHGALRCPRSRSDRLPGTQAAGRVASSGSCNCSLAWLLSSAGKSGATQDLVSPCDQRAKKSQDATCLTPFLSWAFAPPLWQVQLLLSRGCTSCDHF